MAEKAPTSINGKGEKVKVIHRRLYISEKPEFLDSAAVESHFSLSRSLLYSLEAAGLIEGVSLKRDDKKKRGKKLWNCASIRKFLKTQFDNKDSQKIAAA